MRAEAFFATLSVLALFQSAVAGDILNPAYVVPPENELRGQSNDLMLNNDLDYIVKGDDIANTHFRRLGSHQLPGSPTMDGATAFMNDGGNLPKTHNGKDTFDIMEDLANSRNDDMCIFSMQQLPPPNADFATAVDDLQKFHDYGVAAGQRFQDMVGADKNGGSVLFGSCIIGSEGAKSLCANDINASFACNNQRQNSMSKWAQAGTIFRITTTNKAAAKANLQNWRSQMSQHLPMMTWTFMGGNTADGGSKVAGWGHGGGLRAKIVPCSWIDQKYHFPTERYDCDHIDSQGNLQTDEVWQHWHSLCSVWTPDNPQPTCSAPAGAPTPPPTNAPTPAPPSDGTGAASGDSSSTSTRAASLRLSWVAVVNVAAVAIASLL